MDILGVKATPDFERRGSYTALNFSRCNPAYFFVNMYFHIYFLLLNYTFLLWLSYSECLSFFVYYILGCIYLFS